MRINKNKKQSILITGGSGFIGTNAIEYFSTKGFDVLNIDIKKPQNHNHKKYWIECDILDFKKYLNVTNEYKPDFFLHLAARTDLCERIDINGYAANIDGVKNTINIIKQCESIQKSIFASSRMVCKIDYQPKNDNDYCPPNLYGKSKMLGEIIVNESNLDNWIIVRPTSTWGPWFDVPYKIFFTTIQKNLYFNPGNFNPLKSFGFVGNTVFQIDQLLHADRKLVNNKIFYVCDYMPLNLKEWSELIRIDMKLKPITTLPYTLLKIIAKLGDILAGVGWYRVPLTTSRLNNLITDMTYDTKVLESICGTLPYSLEEGVRQTVKWMNANKNYKNSN